MDGRTDGISPRSRGLCPLSEPLPKKLLHRTKIHDVLLAFTLDMKKKDLSARVCDFIEI